MDIVTQQQKMASASRTRTRLGGRPNTKEGAVRRLALAVWWETISGGARKNTPASGTMVAITSTPYSSIVLRQPIAPTPSCSAIGHNAPATY